MFYQAPQIFPLKAFSEVFKPRLFTNLFCVGCFPNDTYERLKDLFFQICPINKRTKDVNTLRHESFHIWNLPLTCLGYERSRNKNTYFIFHNMVGQYHAC